MQPLCFQRWVSSHLPMMVVSVGLWVGCAAHSHSPIPPASSDLVGREAGVHWEKPSRPVGLPGWAFELPASFREVVAVGCSPVARPDRSVELAIDRAYENLARAQYVEVRAWQAELVENQFVFPMQHTTEILDEDAVKRCRSRAVVLDTVVIRGPSGARTVRTYVLVGPSGTMLPLESRTFRKFDSGPPKWFEEPLEAPGYLFGVGSCGFYKRPWEAWDAAEKLARLDLAGQVFTQSNPGIVDQMRRRGGGTLTWDEQEVRADLRPVVVVARSYDPEARVFYALARMPVPTQIKEEFPWPPRRASATAVIPSEFLTQKTDKVSLKNIEQKLSATLDSCGYFEKSYYAVPGGFAIVTRLEQIDPDGRSKEIPDRWSVEVEPLRSFSLEAYLKALFTARCGYYRIIAFIVTPHPFSQSDITVSRDEAMDWVHEGWNKLPSSIGEREYLPKELSSTALIYEFEQPESGKKAELKTPGRLTGRDHLRKAKIWYALEE